MSKSTISTFELFQMFPDAEAARVYMEGKRWPDGTIKEEIRYVLGCVWRHARASVSSERNENLVECTTICKKHDFSQYPS